MGEVTQILNKERFMTDYIAKRAQSTLISLGSYLLEYSPEEQLYRLLVPDSTGTGYSIRHLFRHIYRIWNNILVAETLYGDEKTIDLTKKE